MKKILNVCSPTLPPIEDLKPYLEEIWESRVLTNNGPLHQKLEYELCKYLGVPYISLFCNATTALIIALKALDVRDEVITSPYSFVATANSLLWSGVKPIFVDIDPLTLNLDPSKIEAAITPRTTAIMPVHVYGTPCNVDLIEDIANKNNLKVIYDAAHAFAVECHCGSLLNHGELSVLSFHATKVFNTFEGGAIVCKDIETKRKIDKLKNFGFNGETSVITPGINGKMNEFSAALGLVQLDSIDNQIEKRKKIDAIYRDALSTISGIKCLNQGAVIKKNYSYFPIFVEGNFPLNRDELYKKMKSNGINTRRYFHPLITDFEIFKDSIEIDRSSLKFAKQASDSVICLPIYPDLKFSEQNLVIKNIKKYNKKN